MKITVYLLVFAALVASQPSWAQNGWLHARSEEKFQQAFQGVFIEGRKYDCHQAHFEGEWALLDVQQQGGAEQEVLYHFEDGQWTFDHFVGRPGGALKRLDLVSSGLPADVVARLGYGVVSLRASEQLKALARSRHDGWYGIATYGDKMYAATRVDDTVDSATIWEYGAGQWRKVGQFGEGSLAETFAPMHISAYTGSCILAGTALSGKP